MAPPRGSGAWPSSDDYTWFSLAIIVCGLVFGGYLLWQFEHAEISAGVMQVQHWQMTLIHQFTDRYDIADREVLAADPAQVGLAQLIGLCRDVGLFFRFPAALLIGSLGVFCLVWAPSGRFRRNLDLDGLMREHARSFRTIAPFVGRSLKLVGVRSGEPRPADPTLSVAEWVERWAADGEGRFDEIRCRSALARQLGPVWQGVGSGAPAVRVMFVVFALHLAQRREEAVELLGGLAESFGASGAEREGPEKPLSFAAPVVCHIDHLLRDVLLVRPAAEIAARHAYTVPALMTVLTEARARAGVLAPAQFNFLKLVDRRLWYALHALGFPLEGPGQQPLPNARVEALGARDHWEIERIAGVPIFRPMVDRAVAAIRGAIGDADVPEVSTTVKEVARRSQPKPGQ
jgi:intracellular multiplication protein IcmP